jgi:hypothetical protein
LGYTFGMDFKVSNYYERVVWSHTLESGKRNA